MNLVGQGEVKGSGSKVKGSDSLKLSGLSFEIQVNGITKLTGSPMNLGAELSFNTQIKHPGRSSKLNYTYKLPAGSYVSVNTIAGNVSSQKLTKLQTQLQQTKTILETNRNIVFLSSFVRSSIK